MELIVHLEIIFHRCKFLRRHNCHQHWSRAIVVRFAGLFRHLPEALSQWREGVEYLVLCHQDGFHHRLDEPVQIIPQQGLFRVDRRGLADRRIQGVARARDSPFMAWLLMFWLNCSAWVG